jgi:hypothetical protein
MQIILPTYDVLVLVLVNTFLIKKNFKIKTLFANNKNFPFFILYAYLIRKKNQTYLYITNLFVVLVVSFRLINVYILFLVSFDSIFAYKKHSFGVDINASFLSLDRLYPNWEHFVVINSLN